MKRDVVAVLVLALVLTACTGCTKTKETDLPESKAGEETAKKNDTPADTVTEKKMYTFVDVLGEAYEAELLEDIPACTYDYEYLKWENGYPYYKDKDGNTLSELGVDVSKYQGTVDWNQVRDAGMSFAIIRLGFRGYGEEGNLVLDEYYEQNMQGALAAGMKVGVYFFSQAVTEEEAREEAQFVLEHTSGYELDGPIVFDTEEIKDDTARTDNLTREAFTRHCIVFCDMVKEAGKHPMIYANMKWMAYTLELEKLTEYEKWYADYEPIPQCPYEFTIWQYTESGAVPGIQGNVDINVWFYR